MLDRALAKTFSSFSTLFLLACVVTVPAHEIHAYVFKDTLAIRELADDVASFPPGRQVRGVDSGDISAERNWLLIVLTLEAALLPIFYRAGRRVIAVADEGGVPEVLDAYRHLRSKTETRPLSLGPIAVGVAFASVCGWLVWAIGVLVADVAAPDRTWAVVGLVRGAAVATFTALAAGTAAALSGPARTSAPPPTEPDVY